MLDTLRRITLELNRATTLSGALSIVVRRIKESLAVDACSIYVVDASGGSCILMATDGLDPKSVGRIQFSRSQGLVGTVLESGQALNITNVQQDPRFRYFPEHGEEAYHAFLGVPIMQYGQVLGILSMRQTNDRTFTAGEEAFLLTIAAEVARVKRTIRAFTRRLAQDLSAAALRVEDAAEVHRLLESAFAEVGLGSLLATGGSGALAENNQGST